MEHLVLTRNNRAGKSDLFWDDILPTLPGRGRHGRQRCCIALIRFPCSRKTVPRCLCTPDDLPSGWALLR